MKLHHVIPRRTPHARGVAAVELSIIMALFMFILPATFLFGRVFWQYNVLKNATDNAARYLARSTVADLGASANIAAQMVTNAARESGMSTAPTDFGVAVDCNGVLSCSFGTPTSITVKAGAQIDDPAFIDGFTGIWLPNGSWQVSAVSTAGYPN